MNRISEFIQQHWGDVASVAGVLISLVGFVVTIMSVVASTKAAQRAEDAALEVRDKFLRTDTIMELSGAIAIMEEIK